MNDHLFQAQKSLDIADYLLSKTFPIVGSAKMLLAILEDIHLSHLHILRYLFGNLPFPKLLSSFSSQKRFSDFHSLVLQTRNIIDEHKLSDVEFERNDKFIICHNNTILEKLGVDDVKQYLFKSRKLLDLVTI